MSEMLPILFENDDIVVVNKPEGLASIPERRKDRPSLRIMLSEMYEQKLRIVHRLDKHTSGVIIFAKNPRTHRFITRQFAERTVQKFYLALVHGVLDDDQGVIDKRLRKYGSGRVAIDDEHGKECLTEFQVVERFDSYTLCQVHPMTGRLHQIRVHFFSIGHPIVGDPYYGDREFQSQFPRLMLHAAKISFQMPPDEQLTIEAPLPESFTEVMQQLTNI